MPITKTGTKLIKMAMPRWRAVFQLLGNISQHAIQQGKRPPAWIKRFPYRRELPPNMQGRLNELREKRGPKNGIGVTSETYSSELQPLKLMKSERNKLLGIQRGNKNIRERLGYSSVDPANISYEQLAAHRFKTLESMMNNQQNPVRLVRDTQVYDNLDLLIPGKSPRLPIPKRSPNDIGNISTDSKHKLINIHNYSLPETMAFDSPVVPFGEEYIIKTPKKIFKPKNKAFFDAFMERHELYEAQALEKAIQRSIQSRMQGKSKPAKSFLKYPGKLKSAHSGNEYTNHTDMNVIVKERRDLDTFTHTSNPAYKFVRKVRDAVERPYMDAAGGFDPAKAVQPHKPIDVFKNHESQFFRNTKKPVPVGNDLILPAK